MTLRKTIDNINVMVSTGDIKKVDTRSKYNAHLWIHENTVLKNHTSVYNLLTNQFITDEEIERIIL
jgi:hypothetical protein